MKTQMTTSLMSALLSVGILSTNLAQAQDYSNNQLQFSTLSKTRDGREIRNGRGGIAAGAKIVVDFQGNRKLYVYSYMLGTCSIDQKVLKLMSLDALAALMNEAQSNVGVECIVDHYKDALQNQPSVVFEAKRVDFWFIVGREDGLRIQDGKQVNP
jgi:hypothetical protein